MSENLEPLRREAPMARSSGGGMQSGGFREMAKMLLPAILSFGIIYLAILPGYVTKSDDTKNKNALAGSITAIDTRLKGDENTLATISSQYTTLSGQVRDAQTVVGGLANAARDIAAIQKSLNDLSAKVNGLPSSQPDLNPLKTQITSIQTSLDAVKVDVATLKTAPSVPVSSPPTISGFTPLTGTAGTSVVITGTNFNAASAVTFGGTAATFVVNSGTQITATVGNGNDGAVGVVTPAGSSISSLLFDYTGTTTAGTVSISAVGDLFGQPYVVFSGVTANTTTTRQFQFTLNNNSGAQIKNVQLLVALQSLTSDFQPTELPTGATIKITSVSLIGTSWTAQPVGGGVYAFTNQILSGILAGLGSINQNTGSTQYNVSVTVTTTDTPITSIYMYPTVKVLSYQ